jgi:Family of unknown function (DUF5317)
MPVSFDAIQATDQTRWFEDPTRFRRDVTITPETNLALLSDVAPEPAWIPRRGVLSVGDVLLSAGAAALVFCSLRTGGLGRGTGAWRGPRPSAVTLRGRG